LNYRNNLKDGKEISYYENGKLKSIVNFVGGIKTGPAEWYYEEGGLESKGEIF
jgi:antitoxin component YwqK of YwqJK toxin-antitoxin module